MNNFLVNEQNTIKSLELESVIEILVLLQNIDSESNISIVDINKLLTLPILTLINISNYLRDLDINEIKN